MPEEPKVKSTFDKQLLGYARWGGKTLVLMIASRNARWVIMSLAAVWTGYLLYTNISQTLNQPVQLPVGVTANNPELDVPALDAINNARITRAGYVFRSFAAYDTLFAPAPSVAPVVVQP